MKMSTKLVLIVLTGTVLTFPVMAESSRHAHSHARAMASTGGAQGSAAPTIQSRSGAATSMPMQDCIRVAFPQCSGGN